MPDIFDTVAESPQDVFDKIAAQPTKRQGPASRIIPYAKAIGELPSAVGKAALESLPYIGMGVGAAAAIPLASPFAAPGGAYIGGAGGEALKQSISRAVGLPAPPTGEEAATEIGTAGLSGATLEMGGQIAGELLSPIARTIRSGWESIRKFPREALNLGDARLAAETFAHDTAMTVRDKVLKPVAEAVHADAQQAMKSVEEAVDAAFPQGAINPSALSQNIHEIAKDVVKIPERYPASLQKLAEFLTSTQGRMATFGEIKQLRTGLDKDINERAMSTYAESVKEVMRQARAQLSVGLDQAAQMAGQGKEWLKATSKWYNYKEDFYRSKLGDVLEGENARAVMSPFSGPTGQELLRRLNRYKDFGLDHKALLSGINAYKHITKEMALATPTTIRSLRRAITARIFQSPKLAEIAAKPSTKELEAVRSLPPPPRPGRTLAALPEEAAPEVPSAPVGGVPQPKPTTLPPPPTEATGAAEAAAEKTIPADIESPYEEVRGRISKLQMYNRAISKLRGSGKKMLTDAEAEWVEERTGTDLSDAEQHPKALKALQKQRAKLLGATKEAAKKGAK